MALCIHRPPAVRIPGCLLATYHFAFHGKLYAQVSGIFSRHLLLQESAVKVTRRLPQGFLAFRALTTAPMDGAGDDAMVHA
jgi:hypothetical protein